jgi:hypothetical protein
MKDDKLDYLIEKIKTKKIFFINVNHQFAVLDLEMIAVENRSSVHDHDSD